MSNTIQNLLDRAKQLQQEKKFLPARALYHQILKTEPQHLEALHLLGILCNQLNEADTAIQYLQQVLTLNPNLPAVYHNLGLVYQGKNDWDRAIDYYRRAIQLNPQYASAFHKLGNIYKEIEQPELAKKNYEIAVSLQSNYAEAWLDFGKFFKQQNQLNAARDCFEKALQFNAKSYQASFELGNLYSEAQQYERALEYYLQTLRLKSDYEECYTRLGRLYDEICHWENYEKRQQKIREIIKKELNSTDQFASVDPFTPLAYAWPATETAAVAYNYSKAISKKAAPLRQKFNFKFKQHTKPKLRIGYLSCGFRQHPTAHLAYNLLKTHDRNQFEVIAFSLDKDDQSKYRQHFSETADQFIDLHNLTDTAAAQKIYENNIDILIELDGYIRNARTGITALRPAPIQVNYLGFPGTTGADFFDYFIGDKIAITPATAHTFAEKIIYMPHSYQINNNEQAISTTTPTRAQYHLPATGFIYCCFNNPYKIEPKIFTIWMNILKSVPGGVLWLYSNGAKTETNLKKAAAKHGIDPTRLIFAKAEEKSLHLARLQLADLFLDTLYYNAHTTCSDALWAGVPVLTCPGENFPSRVGASLLTAIGLPELIMPDLKTYQATAIALAKNPEQLKLLRQKLAANRLTQPLFDTQLFVRNLEKAYQQIWQRYVNSQTPTDLFVK